MWISYILNEEVISKKEIQTIGNTMKTVKYKNYTVTRMDSGSIEATKNGHIASPTKPLLRELAQELNVSLENANGNLHITRQLGVLVMRAIEKQSTK